MEPFIAAAAVAVPLYTAGKLGVRRLADPAWAVRGGIAALFLVASVAHFGGMRGDLIAMVPPQLPAPGALVTATGVLELAGAAGILIPRTAPWAAAGLAALLVAMFPANIHAAEAGLQVAFGDALLPRAVLQLAAIAATAGVAGVLLRRQARSTEEALRHPANRPTMRDGNSIR